MSLQLVAKYLNQLHHYVPRSEYQQKTEGVMLGTDFKNLSNFVAISGVNWHFATPCLKPHSFSHFRIFQHNTMWPLSMSVTYTPVDHTWLKVVTDLILGPYKFEITFGPVYKRDISQKQAV